MVFFDHGQTGRNGSVQNDQPNQPTVPTGPRIAQFFFTTGEPTVGLVSSVRSDRLKAQALNRRFQQHASRFLILRTIILYFIYYNYIIYTPNLRLITLSRLRLIAKVEMKSNKADRTILQFNNII